MRKKNKKVFVAMSGGVDSSVAAALLKEKGYDVVGITMCFSISYPKKRKPSCCGAEGIADAKRAAQILDIPHYVLDFASDINDYIIEDFVNEYLNGRTPNPCVRCNQYLKFDILYKKVRGLGADFLATGHYAKIEFSRYKKKYYLRKARDKSKDQSYFLYGLKKEVLPFLLFPLGNITKAQVRNLAKKYKLNTAEKPESQDICFVPESGYKDFIRERLGDSMMVPGPFKDENGEVVGKHKGIINYTIGQRDQLGLSLGRRVYVYEIDKKTNTVFVGPRDKLYSRGLYATQLNLIGMDFSKKKVEANVRIRYNASEVKAYAACVDKYKIRIEFKKPQRSVTPGQSLVLYKRDIVLGGAVIDEAIKEFKKQKGICDGDTIKPREYQRIRARPGDRKDASRHPESP